MSHPLTVLHQAEALAAEANRTLAQARSAVATAKNRSGFFPPSNALASRKGKGKEAQKKNEGFIVSHLWPK